MAMRLIDVTLASLALVAALPLCLAAAAGIWICDGWPVLYRSRRVGQHGRVFTMLKLRTMRSAPAASARITSDGDRRVFTFGAHLRRWKIDELPQLLNVLRGDMAIIGPRPEDPDIVDRFYGPVARETLRVRPGLASPGSIYNFTHGERQLGAVDAEAAYIAGLLPRKLALDLVYIRTASLRYDMRLMCRAALVIVARGLGRQTFSDPPELACARQLESLMQAAPPPAPVSLANPDSLPKAG